MTFFYALVNSLFDLLFRPFERLPPILALLVFSLLTALLMILAFRYMSNQREIRRAKDRIQAHLLEVRLFQDQVGVVLRTYPRILRGTLVYLRHSLKPLTVMLVPLVLLLVQLEMRLGYRPLHPGESVLIAARLAQPEALEAVALNVPPGLLLTAPPLRIPTEREVDWRIRGDQPGEYVVAVQLGDRAFPKRVVVSTRVARTSPLRPRQNWWDQLLYPGEEPIAAGEAVEAIEVKYPPRTLSFGLFGADWLIPFFVISILAGYAMKGIFKTEF